ncbi:MAG: glucoamylase family protein [Candidatus Korobacteraceae bacterium]
MPVTNHRDVLLEAADRVEATDSAPARNRELAQRAQDWAHQLVWLPATKHSAHFADRLSALNRRLQPLLAQFDVPLDPEEKVPEDVQWLHDNVRLVRVTHAAVGESASALRRVPHVRTPSQRVMPRVLAIAQDLLASRDYRYSDHAFSTYMEAFQTVTGLDMGELALLIPSLKLVVLEEFVDRAEKVVAAPEQSQRIRDLFGSMRELSEAPWKELLEPLIVFETILAADPAKAYARSDYQSRELYRHTIAHYAEHSDCSELEIAQLAIELAQESTRHPATDPRLTWRKSHVGYYLIGEGARQLRARAGVRLPFGESVQDFLHRNPEEFYLGGVEILTLIIVIAIITPVFNSFNTFWARIIAILVVLLPASQAAVEMMNYLTTALLPPRILPKLDFSEGIPDDAVTMVVVPTLLLNEKQVRRLVEDLEVRYLGNASRNLHFALLTDLPDSAETPNEDDLLVKFCEKLINDLNAKYAGAGMGSFALFHRHRIYNPREGVWMGWERKRGKLLDFNRLIKGRYDSFPVKIGDLSLLPHVRFVLTLDTDTELPRGAAHRLVGAMTHPLNQAIVDPHDNIVVAGYGILQPRVGISVQSAAKSRLANIYSGQTGFDIYTRATSDVYQDLKGEGIFTGKGIYEVDTLSKVLEHRFPRNALLSHDLIEGAYARAGLVSDVEVIDDYPSHYSAYNRRKHRWVRGDWQIVSWLFANVLDEAGRRVPNPISFLSRWKILDNLRRSLVEPGIFLLFVLGWTIMPGKPLYWTLVTIAVLFVPPWFQFAFSVLRALFSLRLSPMRDALAGLGSAMVSVFLTLTFLAHQTMISADAVLRTFYRRMVSRQRLLQWETAAQAETHGKRTFVDALLNWTPAVAAAVGALAYFTHRHAVSAIYSALPILLLWAFSKPVSFWLNRPPRPLHKNVTLGDQRFLRRAALYIWRYFATFSNEEHNWLIPDNVQEEPPRVAARLSPTNLGFLFNARQVACELGYLTVPEFAELNLRTMSTVARLPKEHGHLYNWYDTRTLAPDRPRFISTVDSGNLAASLLTLKGGCLEMLQQPLLSPTLLHGYADYVCALAELKVVSRKTARALEKPSDIDWLERLLTSVEFAPARTKPDSTSDAAWFTQQATHLVEEVQRNVRDYMPWLLPEFKTLRQDPGFADVADCGAVSLARLPECIEQLQGKLEVATTLGVEPADLRKKLLPLLPAARDNSLRLVEELRSLASQCERLVREMDFAFLLDRRRKLLSIGCDAETGKVHAACYDLLASEARIAAFIAIAKGDIPQESWFQMSRSHVVVDGLPVLISWTGTMFEYLMPSLWMRSYPDTLLERSKEVAVLAQQQYADDKHIPWGISECAYAKLEDQGVYGYRAFGVPHLALQQDEERLVVAPYATMLALMIDPAQAIRNLRWMSKKGWFGTYGYYEAADFTRDVRPSRRQRFALVRSWMVHHQGMALLSIANLLQDGVVQRWFRRDARVKATELLSQERPVSHVPATPKKKRQPRPRTRAAHAK